MTAQAAVAPAASDRRPRRRRSVTVGLAVLVALLAIVTLGIGDYPLTIPQVLRAMVTDAGFDTTVVVEWRMPRVAAALAFGAALAVSGALFQSLTRNPLGSPDIIGFATGSYTGVLIVTTFMAGTPLASTLGTAGAALIGGLVTALLVYVLSWRRGVTGMHLIITGIAVTAMLQALNLWLQLRAKVEVAMSAFVWSAGSLGTVSWQNIAPALVGLVICGAATVLIVPALQQLELGDDAAAAHGVRVETARLGILIIGVALTAIATAVAGPIAFVALVSPQVAKRLVGGAGLPLIASALTGAFLLLTADLAAQYALPESIPVGIVTVVLGGVYLLALLLRSARARA